MNLSITLTRTARQISTMTRISTTPLLRRGHRWMQTQTRTETSTPNSPSTSALPAETFEISSSADLLANEPVELDSPITARGFSSSAEQCLLANSLPIQHKPSHKYHVATLHFRSYTPAIAQLNLAVEFARRTSAALSIPCSNVVSLPTRTELQTVPTGPFVHKKSQENFWRKTHKRALKLWDADEESLSVFLEYLRTNAVPGVGIRAQQVLYRPVGFSNDYQAKEQSELKQTSGKEEKIKEMAKDIVAGADAPGAEGQDTNGTGRMLAPTEA